MCENFFACPSPAKHDFTIFKCNRCPLFGQRGIPRFPSLPKEIPNNTILFLPGRVLWEIHIDRAVARPSRPQKKGNKNRILTGKLKQLQKGLKAARNRRFITGGNRDA
jgi:hypothetical protein